MTESVAEREAPSKKNDLVLVHGVTDDGAGVRVLRRRESSLEAGEMRPLEQGKPITGEVVKLTPRPECSALFDAETQVTVSGGVAQAEPSAAEGARGGASSRSGPPQVASRSYRKNWDAVWKRKKRAALN